MPNGALKELLDLFPKEEKPPISPQPVPIPEERKGGVPSLEETPVQFKDYRGQSIDAILKPDNSIWIQDRQIGTFLPDINQIEFSPEYAEEAIKQLEFDLRAAYAKKEAFPSFQIPEYLVNYEVTKKDFEEAQKLSEAEQRAMKVPSSSIQRSIDVWQGKITSTQALLMGLEELTAPLEFGAKVAGAALTAPFRAEQAMPTKAFWEEEFVPELLEKYEEWEEPVWWVGLPWAPEYKVRPTKGLVEFIPWLLTGMGVSKTAIQKLFQQVVKIEAKQAAGKVLTVAEKATLARAAELEAKISAQIAPKIAMPTIEELIAANYSPTAAAALGQKLTKAPGIIGSVNRSLLPMQAAKTDAEKAVIAWKGLTNDTAPSLARIEMEVVYAKDFPFKFAPPVYPVKPTISAKIAGIKPIEEGLVKNVGVKKHRPFIQAIAEFPNRYILTKAQRAELDLLDTLLSKQLAREIAIGVNVKPVGLKPGQRYMPRFLKEIQDLETKALTEIRRGVSTRPGIKPSSFRTRYYEEILDGMVAGKRYTTDLRAAVEMRLTAGNKAIADKMLGDFLRPLGQLPKERIPATIRTARELVVTKRQALRNISSLIEQINAKATIDWHSWLGIKKYYPKEYTQLRTISKKGGLVPQSLKTWIVDEKVALKIASKEITPKYKLALSQARLSAIGKEGSINHAALQGEIFPIDIASPVNELITKEITSHQVLNTIGKINDVARMGQTAIDTGLGLIQGQLVLFNNPKAWGKMWEIGLKTIWNPKYRARYGVMNREFETLIATHGGAAFGGSEFTLAARPGGWLEKIPGIGVAFKRFGHYFESTIDTARIELLKSKLPHYIAKYGRELTERELTDLVVNIDHMVGISSMSRLGMSKFIQVLSRDVMYAPRYYLGFVSFLGRAFQGGIGGDLAREALAKWLFGSACFMSGMAVVLGQKERIIPTKDKPIPTMFDPTSGEMMTVEIAGVHMGLGGVWIAGLRLLGSLAKTAVDDPSDFISIDPHENPLLRYGYGRASPVASGVIDIVTGKNYLGERLDTPDDYLKEVIDKTFPFWMAGQITDVPKAGWQKGVAEWFGLRAWMVQYRELAQKYAEEHIKDIPDDMVMPWQKERIAEGRPMRYEDLNNEQRAWLLLTFQDYREAEEKRREEKTKKGTDFEVIDIQARELLDADYNTSLEEIAKGVMAGEATIADYMNQAEYYRRIRSGQYQYRAVFEKLADPDRWESINKWIEENKKPEDEAYDNYMELRGNPPKVGGVPDWDAWDKAINDYLSMLDIATREYIERRQDDWINNLPENAQKIERLILDCETVLDTYYEYPEGKARLNYRDMHPEVDARLVILRGLKPRSREAVKITQELLARYGLAAISTSTRVIGETIPTTPQYKQPPSSPPPEGLKELLDLFK